MSTSTIQYVNPLLSSIATEYTFCPKCGVDVTIYSHEDDCPLIRYNKTASATLTATTTTATITSTIAENPLSTVTTATTNAATAASAVVTT
ncbi:uncharacterized protein BX663DRAFT_508642, partial [Cokeromyces recurvatus]|uniref:uncharacterized protein n=1 Tax=Cokeromyces recurvatus TaxID=90255 RepID=UPI00222074F9